VSMTGKIERVEVITSSQRRRRWSAEEKAAIVQETYAPEMSVSLVARRHGIAPNQLFTWRRLYASGALSAVGAGEEVVAASEYRAMQHQVRELQRLRLSFGRPTVRHVGVAGDAPARDRGEGYHRPDAPLQRRQSL
jgi:transposase